MSQTWTGSENGAERSVSTSSVIASAPLSTSLDRGPFISAMRPDEENILAYAGSSESMVDFFTFPRTSLWTMYVAKLTSDCATTAIFGVKPAFSIIENAISCILEYLRFVDVAYALDITNSKIFE